LISFVSLDGIRYRFVQNYPERSPLVLRFSPAIDVVMIPQEATVLVFL
jgi:hypothetical protein